MMLKAGLRTRVSFLICLSAAGVHAASPQAGAPAPAFTAAQWANAKAAVSPMTFEGRAVLVVQWATWCPACNEAIPQLNQILAKHAPRGLQIVGISKEPIPAIRAHAEQKQIKYLVGSGGAEGYASPGIPHAWLVSPERTVLWQGFPAHLKDETIAKALKTALAPPNLTHLPPGLEELDAAVKDGRYTEVLRYVRKLAVTSPRLKPDIDKVIGELNTYGERLLVRAQRIAEDGNPGEALKLVLDIARNLPGTPVAGDCREEQAELRAESEALQLVVRARNMIQQNKAQQATALLQQVTKSTKYEKTRAREEAEELLAAPKPPSPPS